MNEGRPGGRSRRVIRHRPVQTGHLQQAGHHPCRLLERKLEQYLEG